jgi:hypothetical protein
MFLLDGRPLSLDRAFTDIDGIQRPANWLRLATPDERIAAGITEVPDLPTWDQRFYWGYDADGALIPKDHAQLVEQWVGQAKTTAASLLAPFDWYIVRETETGKAVPQAVLDYRAAVRVVSDNREVMIKGTTDTEQLAAVVTGDFGGMFPWPRGPFDPAPRQPADDPVIDGTTSGTVTGDSDTVVIDSVDFTGGGTTAAVIDSGSTVFGADSGVDTVTFS